MKVCVVCREHPTLHFNGGLSIAAWNTARAAHDAGIDVEFVTASGKGDFGEQRSILEGIKVLCLPNAKHDDYASWHPAVVKWWSTAVKDMDLIHCHGYSGSPIAIGGAPCPIIFHDHGSKEGYVQTLLTDAIMRTGPTPAFWKQLEEFHKNVYFQPAMPAGESDFDHMRRYDCVIATSHISEMDFRTRYLLTNVELFYHPIYLPEIDKPEKKEGEKPVVAVFAGNLDNPWKCGPMWLRKLEPLKDEIHLLMVGPGPVTVEYAKGVFPSMYATGHLSEEAALRWLAEADVLYEPSTHHIGLNLTGISAIGLGVPVVSFPTAGHTDLIGNDEAGRVVDSVEPCGVAEAVRSVLKNREDFSQGALRRFSARFSPRWAALSINRIYEGLVG